MLITLYSSSAPICRHPIKLRRTGEDGKEICTVCDKIIQKGRPRVNSSQSTTSPTPTPTPTPTSTTDKMNPGTPAINQLRAKSAIKAMKTATGLKVGKPGKTTTTSATKRRVIYDSDEETEKHNKNKKMSREEWEEEEERRYRREEKYNIIIQLLESLDGHDDELHLDYGKYLRDENCPILKQVEREVAAGNLVIRDRFNKAQNREEILAQIKKFNEEEDAEQEEEEDEADTVILQDEEKEEENMELVDDEAEEAQETDVDEGLSEAEGENTWQGETPKKVKGRIIKPVASDASSSEDSETDDDEIVDYSGGKKPVKTHKGRRQGGKAWLGGTLFAWREYRKVDYTKGQLGSKVYENFILCRKYNCKLTGKEKNYTFSIPLDFIQNLRKVLRDLQTESTAQLEKENKKKTSKNKK